MVYLKPPLDARDSESGLMHWAVKLLVRFVRLLPKCIHKTRFSKKTKAIQSYGFY